jgi:hypothetical protein
MLEHSCGDLLPFSHKSISDVGHWCWVNRPGSQLAFKFIPKVFNGVEVRALCSPVKFFHTYLNKLFLYRPTFVHGGVVMLKQERAFPKLLPQSSTEWSRMSLYAVALRCPFTETQGPSPNHEQQLQTIIPPPPTFTVGTMH